MTLYLLLTLNEAENCKVWRPFQVPQIVAEEVLIQHGWNPQSAYEACQNLNWDFIRVSEEVQIGL